jgi:predicted DNA-binding transcriptional regulator AlpA
MAAKQPTDLNEAVTTDEVIDDLAGVVKLAEMLGVTRSSIYRYIARDDFPVPIVALKRSRAWSWKEVAEWAKRTLPADNLWRTTTQDYLHPSREDLANALTGLEVVKLAPHNGEAP